MTRDAAKQFDRNLQTANIWLGEIADGLAVNRRNAWNVLGAVLHALRDHLSADQAAHLGNQLPLLIRGLFYEQWHPTGGRAKSRTLADFVNLVRSRLSTSQNVNIEEAVKFVLSVLAHHPRGEMRKVLKALPPKIRALAPPEEEVAEYPAESPFAWE